MNFINPNYFFTPQIIRQMLEFCARNSFQHINSLLSSCDDAEIILDKNYENALRKINAEMQKIYSDALSGKTDTRLFNTSNNNLITLLERLKFEGFNGYPIMLQDTLHYLYEQRFFKLLFFDTQNAGDVQIITKFNAEPKLSQTYLTYNCLYFFGIIGAIHAGTLLHSDKFMHTVLPEIRQKLTSSANDFNRICRALTLSKGNLTQQSLNVQRTSFINANNGMLNLLESIHACSPQIFRGDEYVTLPQSFFDGIQHMIAEHRITNSACTANLSELKIPM